MSLYLEFKKMPRYRGFIKGKPEPYELSEVV